MDNHLEKHALTITDTSSLSCKRSSRYGILTLLCYLCGVYGVLFSITAAFALSYSLLVYPIVGVLAIGIWFLCFEKPNYIRYVFIMAIVLYGMTFLIIRNQVYAVVYGVANNIKNFYGLELYVSGEYASDTSVFIIALLFLLAASIYYIIYEEKNKIAVYIVAITPFLLELLLGQYPGIVITMCLVFFCVGTNTILGQKMQTLSRRKAKKSLVFYNSISDTKALTSAGWISCITTILVFLSVYIVTMPFMGNLMEEANRRGTQFLGIIMNDDVKEILSELDVGIDEGHINRGDLLRTGRIDLEIMVSEPIQSEVYIKGFIGSSFTGEKWREIKEMDFFSSLNSQYQKRENRTWNVLTHRSYYMMKESANTIGLAVPNQMRIEIMRENDRTLYAPYVSSYKGMNGYAYIFDFYEDIQWERNKEALYQTQSYPGQEQYEEFVYDEYLEIPTEGLTRLKQLCEENILNSTEEVTQFIISTLQENTTYTLTPGDFPPEEEIIEYFLFEGKKGYCVHYATTATLMYRMYGIPARYASGYVAYPDSFIEQESGVYKAILRDNVAHAWVEIYDPEIGWYPVEVTPSVIVEDIREITSEPEDAETEEEESEILEEQEDTDIHSEEVEEPDDEIIPSPEQGNRINLVEYKEFFIVSIALTIIILGLYYRRKMLLKARKNEPVGVVFKRMLKVMQTRNCLQGYTGIEEDFVDAFLVNVPGIYKEEVLEMMEILYKAAYSEDEISAEEVQYINDIYDRVIAQTTKRMSKIKYVYYKIIKVYF